MSRTHQVAAFGLALIFGLAAPATYTSGALGSRELNGKFRVRLVGEVENLGVECNRVAQGRFTVSGAMSDRGSFDARFLECHRALGPYVRTLNGSHGSIHIKGGATYWKITGGTGKYSGLRGQGREKNFLGAHGRYRVTMTGMASR